jgi:hypothetical protein
MEPSPPVAAPIAVAALAPEPPATPVPTPPRAADVPLPLTRPATLAPPPAATATADTAAAEQASQQSPAGTEGVGTTRVATVPLPPMRPSDLLPVSGPVYANVPLPPARPVTLASLGAMVPLPAPVDPSSTAGLQQARPGPARSVEADAPGGAASAYDRNAITALFTAAAIGPGTTQPLRAPVKTSKAKPTDREVVGAMDKPAVAMSSGFAAPAAAELRSDRFSGPAVKPVASVSFAR